MKTLPEELQYALLPEEQERLIKKINDLEWGVYLPIKKLSSVYVSSSIEKFDDLLIEVQLTWGCDEQGWEQTAYVSISRNELKDHEHTL